MDVTSLLPRGVGAARKILRTLTLKPFKNIFTSFLGVFMAEEYFKNDFNFYINICPLPGNVGPVKKFNV
jgi:hypothetical protein